jgi:hypothetical protein
MKIFNLWNESQIMFAVAYSKNLEEAIEKVAKLSDSNNNEWSGEEFTEDVNGNGIVFFS